MGKRAVLLGLSLGDGFQLVRSRRGWGRQQGCHNTWNTENKGHISCRGQSPTASILDTAGWGPLPNYLFGPVVTLLPVPGTPTPGFS